MQSAKERVSKQVNEEIQQLLTHPTAKVHVHHEVFVLQIFNFFLLKKSLLLRKVCDKILEFLAIE